MERNILWPKDYSFRNQNSSALGATIFQHIGSIQAMIIESDHFFSLMIPFDSNQANQIAALLAVFDEGSFTAAAKFLQRHPTILSKRITELEARLGIRLLGRNTRTIRFTEAGLLYVKRMQAARDAIRDAEDEISAQAVTLSGSLRIALPGAFGRQWIAPFIAEFAMQHPELDLYVNYSDDFIDLIREAYDVAIRVGELKDSRLRASKLCDHDRILAAAPDYLNRYGTPVLPVELRGHRCLVFSGLQSLPFWELYQGAKREQIRVAAPMTSNDNEALLSAAMAGLGILAGGEWLMRKEIAAGKLVRVLPDWRLDNQSAIYLVRPSIKHAPAKIRVFKQWIEKCFYPKAPWMLPSSVGKNGIALDELSASDQ